MSGKTTQQEENDGDDMTVEPVAGPGLGEGICICSLPKTNTREGQEESTDTSKQ
jgi:hypothetical protein